MGLILCSSSGQGCRTLAEARKGNGDVVMAASDLESFLDIFRFSSSAFAPISTLEIVAHGAPAQLTIGGSVIGLDLLEQLSDPAVTGSFALNASISFISCDIAGSPRGECWLARFARFVLSKCGGTVRGAKHRVIANQQSGYYGVPLAGWVTATVSPGGVVALSGQTTLVQDLVLRRACEVQRIMKVELARQGGPRIQYDPTFLDGDIRDWSRGNVNARLKGYEFLWILHEYLDSTEQQLKRLGYEITPT